MEEGETTNFLSIDQVKGHLTPDLLGRTQRQLSKVDKGAAYRSDQRSFNSRSALATPRENRDKITKKHLRTTSFNSYIREQAITSTTLVKLTKDHS